MQPLNYQVYYPNMLQQGGNNPVNRQNKPGYVYNNQNYYQNNRYESNEKNSCSRKFLYLFSHLPFLPSRWSKATKGTIGLVIFSFFIVAIIVAASLTPLYIQLIEANNPKEIFSIDVTNGLKLQNQPLFDILSKTNEQNRTIDENLTVISETNSLVNQLNSKTVPLLDSSIDKFYNLRLNANQGRSIDVSFTLKTKPIAKSESEKLKDKISNQLKNPQLFDQVRLNNSTLTFNPLEIFISNPVKGEIPATFFSLSATGSKKQDLNAAISLEGPNSPDEFSNSLKNSGQHHDPEYEKKIIEASSYINRLPDRYPGYEQYDPFYQNEQYQPPRYPPNYKPNRPYNPPKLPYRPPQNSYKPPEGLYQQPQNQYQQQNGPYQQQQNQYQQQNGPYQQQDQYQPQNPYQQSQGPYQTGANDDKQNYQAEYPQSNNNEYEKETTYTDSNVYEKEENRKNSENKSTKIDKKKPQKEENKNKLKSASDDEKEKEEVTKDKEEIKETTELINSSASITTSLKKSNEESTKATTQKVTLKISLPKTSETSEKDDNSENTTSATKSTETTVKP